MKKIKILFLFLALPLLSGCGKMTEDKLIKEELLIEVDHFQCDVSVQEIKEFSSYQNLFLTKDGALYEWKKEPFEDGNHCRRIGGDLSFERFLYGVIVGKDQNTYFYIDNILTNEQPLEYPGSINYNLYERNPNIFLFSQNFEESDYDYATSAYYLAMLDHKTVYIYDSENGKEKKRKIGSIDEKENITWVGDNIIKTDKAYYNYGKLNKEACLKKKNVACLYGLAKIDFPTKYYHLIETYSAGYYTLKNKDGIYKRKQ